jgi:flagellar biosynthesis/type III secretory pathway chaperone
MDAVLATPFQKLTSSLDELVKLYRALLEIVRQEKDLLISSDIERLNESNKTKEVLLAKIRAQDLVREKCAQELCLVVGSDPRNPRLLEIAKKMKGEEAQKLHQLHATLSLMIERVSELNKDNEIYTVTALKTLNRALNEVKDTLGGKKTYEKKGKMHEGPHQAGNFVSKEA